MDQFFTFELFQEAIPGAMEELMHMEKEHAEQRYKSQELDEVLGMLVSRSPRSTRSSR